MLTVAQVEDAIENHVFVYEGPHWRTGKPIRNEYSGWKYWDECQGEPVAVTPIGNVRVIESVGGEDQGSHRHMVFQVDTPEGVRWFKKTGYYASHDGTEWDGGFSEVKPAVKTVTVYE